MHDTYTTIWKPEHLEKVAESIPEAVKAEILDVIKTLNQHYGEHRDVDGDLGGYLAVFPESYPRADYEALLRRYHLIGQEPEYAEFLCKKGRVLWIEEVFLCGSDYHLIIIRPAVIETEIKNNNTTGERTMFKRKKPRYCSRGVAEELPLELQAFLWTILEQQKQLHDMDYLQIFQLQIDEEGTLYIHYLQEQPERKQTYALTDVGNEIPEELNGRKIFVMDDETHITMLFAEEY